MSRIIAGALSLAFGLVLLVGYQADDYRPSNPYGGSTLEESVRIHHENAEKRRSRDFHRIAIGVSLVMGILMVIDGTWRRRARAEQDLLDRQTETAP